MAPTATSPPYFKSDELKHTEMTLSLACMTNVETPRAIHGRIISAEGMRYFFFIFKNVFLPVKNEITHIHEIPCDITVAIAAPFTPRPSAKIKIGSRMMLHIAPMITVNIPVFENPCAVTKAFMPRVSCTNIVPRA